MEIGVFAPVTSWQPAGDYLKRLGPAIEERGFESVWLPEHVVLFDDYESEYPYADDGKIPAPPEAGMVEPFAGLTYLAAVTEKLRLGTGICLLPQRNPVYTAKQVADLDWLSDGRVELGIGVGWLEEEFDVLRVPFSNRGTRADEYLEILRTLWTDDVSSFDGELYPLPECRMYPKPVQEPVPVHVGGESDAALRRAARHGQGWFGFNRAPGDVPERVETFEKLLAGEGRSRDDVQVTICSYFHGLTADMVKEYADVGVDRVIGMLVAMQPDDIEPALDGLAPCVEAARQV